MERKQFIKSVLATLVSFSGIGILLRKSLAARITSVSTTSVINDCELAPRETAGPFPNKRSSEMVRRNIIDDRKGTPLHIDLEILNKRNGCNPYPNVHVDIWHCDAKGYYSEYGGNRMQQTNLVDQHFLRGRQVTDSKGKVTFQSIYPGWYRGRAPHIHIEMLKPEGESILVTQVAFPDEVSDSVYTSSNYNGRADTSNQRDGVFRNSLENNMADAVIKDANSGFILKKTIIC